MNKPFHNKYIQHRPFSGNQKYQNKPPAPVGEVKNALGERMLTKRPARLTTHLLVIAVVNKDTL